MANEQSPIKIKKIGHVVLNVSDIERSSKFWTEIMGFRFSDRNEIKPCQSKPYSVMGRSLARSPGKAPAQLDTGSIR